MIQYSQCIIIVVLMENFPRLPVQTDIITTKILQQYFPWGCSELCEDEVQPPDDIHKNINFISKNQMNIIRAIKYGVWNVNSRNFSIYHQIKKDNKKIYCTFCYNWHIYAIGRIQSIDIEKSFLYWQKSQGDDYNGIFKITMLKLGKIKQTPQNQEAHLSDKLKNYWKLLKLNSLSIDQFQQNDNNENLVRKKIGDKQKKKHLQSLKSWNQRSQFWKKNEQKFNSKDNYCSQKK